MDELVKKVMAQTNYDQATAEQKLIEFNYDMMRVLKDYMGIPDVKHDRKIKSVNQEIYKQFVDFVLEKKPSICVHLEPIDELLDQNNLIDRLSTLYFRKRNYLSGYLPYLRQLENEGKIKIVNEQRTFSGSFFIEGHSLIVWYPL
jgi:hypothetical protein